VTSHLNPPPQTVYTVFSRRRLQVTPETSKSIEYVNQESGIRWNLIPLSDTKQTKNIEEKGYHNSTCLSKEYVSFSQTESKKEVSKAENGSYLPNGRDAHHSETKSERHHVETKKSNIANSTHTSNTLPKEPVPRHFYQRDEVSSYSKYKGERYVHFDSDRSRTHSTYVSSEHHSHSGRWGSYKIPRTICETSVSRAVRSLSSRSRSVSQSRTSPESVQNTAKGRYDVRASSHIRSSVSSETSDSHMNRALKLPDNDPSIYNLKSQVATETQLEISKDPSCKPQKKFTHSGEPHSQTHASTAELGTSLKIPQIEPGAKVQLSPYAESNLSEHSSFKRSRRPKIIKLNSETKSSESCNSVNDYDLVASTNSNLICAHNQTEGIKRHLDGKDSNEAIPGSKRQALDDITRTESYNYKEYGKNTDPKQEYNGRVKRQLSPGSVNEKLLKTDKHTKVESSNIKNADTALLEERNTSTELKEETVPKNIKLDVEEGEICEDDNTQPTMENTAEKKETICNINIKSDSKKSNERDRRKEKHKIAHCIGNSHVRLKTYSVEAEERKKNKYSKDGNKKLSSSKTNCKQTVGKKEESESEVVQTEADSNKHGKSTKKEEEIGTNIQKISLLETNKGDGIQNCSEGQTESVKRKEAGKLTEKEKEMKQGKLKEPVTEVSVSHEITETGTVEVSRKSVPRDNSVNLSTESNKASPVISRKFHARRSVEHKLEDSKVVLSVNITPPKDRVGTESSSNGLIVESLDLSAERINSISKTQLGS
jgi:hypothetical protein